MIQVESCDHKVPLHMIAPTKLTTLKITAMARMLPLYYNNVP